MDPLRDLRVVNLVDLRQLLRVSAAEGSPAAAAALGAAAGI